MIEKTARLISQAIKINTVSYSETEKNDFENYKKFLTFLDESFPKIFEKCEKVIINEYSPVYIWRSENKENLKPALFLAHYDVVPAGDESNWKYPPFSGEIVEDVVWGRGALDCKHQLISIMAALERLIEEDYEPKRDIYLAFGFDEEVGGKKGAKKIAEYFRNNDIYFEYVLDEGGVVADGVLPGATKPLAMIGLAEKGSSHVEISIEGEAGHSSMPPKQNAINRMAGLIKAVEDSPMPKRLTSTAKEMFVGIAPYVKQGKMLKNIGPLFPVLGSKLEKDDKLNAFIRTTISFTMISGGEAPNSLPSEVRCVANFRILHGDTFDSTLKHIMHVSDVKDAKYRTILREEPSKISKTDTDFYKKLSKMIKVYFGDVGVVPYLMVGGTDSRHYEIVSDSIYRFTPVLIDEEEFSLVHSPNERVSFENINHMLKFYRLLFKTEML